jgi:DNA-binding SARP family transcriptional activator
VASRSPWKIVWCPADTWRLRKAKTLVKLLALAGGHRIHRDALMAALWPDRDGPAAADNLHQALSVARRAVGGASGGLFILRDDLVLLSEGTVPWLDTDAFDAACLRARRTRNPPGYRAVAALYRGDLLPEDRFEEWAEGPRETFRERHLGLAGGVRRGAVPLGRAHPGGRRRRRRDRRRPVP